MNTDPLDATTTNPCRRPDILEQMVGEDLLLYDPETHQAYQLNEPAMSLHRRCDGQTPLAEMVDVEDDASWQVLSQLAADGVVRNVPAERPRSGVSRRRFLRTVAAGVVMAPVLERLAVPPPAAAMSGQIPGNTPSRWHANPISVPNP